MKKLCIVLVAFSLAGCISFNSAFENAIGRAIMDGSSASSDTGSKSSNTESKSTAQGMQRSPTMNPAIEFYMFYASYYLIGGYGFGDDNFREGEGVTWMIRTTPEGDEAVVKRALLKKVSNGSSWWLLSVVMDGEERFYELLTDQDAGILKVRYRNPESSTVEEFTPSQSGESGERQGTIDPADYSNYSKGIEKVKTKAGSFKAEHLVIEDVNKQGGNQNRSEYWITDKVPGHCVKYIFLNNSDNEGLSGEVIDIRGGYRTRLDSY